jgi:hypothetical protein
MEVSNMPLTRTRLFHGSWLQTVFWLAVLGFAAPITSAAEVDMQEGQWESAISMMWDNPNMPFHVPPIRFKTSSCITQKDMVPNVAQKDQQCETTDYKVDGNKVSWKSKCLSKNGTTEGTGEVVYKGKAYEGSMHMIGTSNDSKKPPMNMTYTLKGNYVGACGQ